MERTRITNTVAYSIIALLAFVFMLPHSMAPWGNGDLPTDICVYYRCAEWMNQGLVMYQDMFDHKGPLVYIVYSLCARTGGLYSVWILDMLIAFGVFSLFYKIGRVYTDEKNSLIITGLMAGYMSLPFVDEGEPEWMAMIGCAYTCYLLAKHLKDEGYFSFGEVFGLSAAVGVCLLTKPNTSAGIIPVALYILYHLIRHWDAKVFGRYAIAVVTGLGVVMLPVIGWMYYQGNLNDFVECYLLFNMQDYGEQVDYNSWQGLLAMSGICLPAFLFFVLFIRQNYRKNRKTLFWISLTFLMSLLLNAFTKNCYPHYVYPCFGSFALLLASIWEEVRGHKIAYGTIWALCLMIGIATFGVRSYLRLVPFDTSHDQEVASFLNENRGESEYVMIYGVEDRSMWSFKNPAYCFHYRLWLLVDGKPASKYFYHPLGMAQSPQMLQASWTKIQEHAPKWIVAHEQNSQDIIQLGYTIYSQDQYGYQILTKR